MIDNSIVYELDPPVWSRSISHILYPQPKEPNYSPDEVTMALENKKTDFSWFNPTDLLDYLKSTTEESWCTDVVKTNDGKSCFFGHVFDWQGGDKDIKRSNQAMDLFESCFATTYMIYPVNDGKSPKYQQDTPKQRCIAYFEDLISGKEKTTYQLMEEYG